MAVTAGWLKSDPEQGVIRVYTDTLQAGNGSSDEYYYTPSRSGRLGIANVNWPHMTLVASNYHDVSTPVTTVLFNLQTRTWEEPVHCQLFPIALSAALLEGVTDPYLFHETNYGIDSRNFGWLTWDGSTITDTLAASLTPPGNTSLYTNPDDPSDHTVSTGDWVLGRPEVDGATSPAVERAMEDLAIGEFLDYTLSTSYLAVTVPVWDQAVRQGESIRYHISGFAWIVVARYSLAQPNFISFGYAGPTSCPNAP